MAEELQAVASEEVDAWFAARARALGRPIRILHIGNIANNAYNNAKLLNRRGFDSDVICPDYYHIMGCPEWEDADFVGSPGNEFDPDWNAVDLKGYVRPRWFAQGPFDTCARYLLARRTRSRLSAAYWWWRLGLERTERGRARLDRLVFLVRGFGTFFRLTFVGFAGALVGLLSVLRVIDPRLVAGVVTLYFALRVIRTVRYGVISVFSRFGLMRPPVAPPVTPDLPAPTPAAPREPTAGELRVAELVRLSAALFPERADRLVADDLTPYLPVVPAWQRLLAHYDIVVGYAAEGVLPLLAGKPYVAYEHGTVRDIPFEATSLGRRTALTYAAADAVYMTNADSLAQALRLRHGKREKILCGVHGVDLDRVRRQAAAAVASRPRSAGRFGIPDDVKLFFAPARHHWKEGFPTWLKGNDRAIRGAALLRDRQPSTFKLVFAEWGKEVELSKALIRELGIEDSVMWVPLLAKKDLIHVYACVDCILDQFVVPAVGSVTIEALAVGKAPVLTLLDDVRLADFYGETIPLLNAGTPEEVAKAMEMVVTDPDACRRTLEACNRWMAVHHSPDFQVESNLRAYRMVLDRQAGAPS